MIIIFVNNVFITIQELKVNYQLLYNYVDIEESGNKGRVLRYFNYHSKVSCEKTALLGL